MRTRAVTAPDVEEAVVVLVAVLDEVLADAEADVADVLVVLAVDADALVLEVVDVLVAVAVAVVVAVDVLVETAVVELVTAAVSVVLATISSSFSSSPRIINICFTRGVYSVMICMRRASVMGVTSMQ